MFLGTGIQSSIIFNYLNSPRCGFGLFHLGLHQTIPWHGLGAQTGQQPFLAGNVNVATLSLKVKEFKSTNAVWSLPAALSARKLLK